MLNNLRDLYPFFQLYLEKVENGAKFNETNAIVICRFSVEFGSSFVFMIACYYQRDLTLEDCVKIFTLQNEHFSNFVKFDVGLHVQGHFLQELDDHTQCDHLVKIFAKID